MKKTSIKDKIEGNELDLSLNGLTEVPVQELASAQKATHLDLSCNEIRSLPNNFASLTHLVKIDLSKNFLTELPQNFGNLTSLEYLDLYGNRITVLPISFCRLKRLKWLDLKNNPLTPKLKEVAGDCLDPKQCQMCAKNVVSFMQSMESELERQKQKRLKEERAKEAARIAKEQEELAEQRRIKKAERERRKAESKAKQANQGKPSNQEYSNDHGKPNAANKMDKTNESKSGSCWKFCCFTFVLLPVLLICSLVGFLVFQGHELQSISRDVQETVLVWWTAFALPQLMAAKAILEDWLQSNGFF